MDVKFAKKLISCWEYRLLFMHNECISFLNLRFENDVKEYGIQPV